MSKTSCYHCGNLCDSNKIVFQEKYFCCNGCQSVYQILSDHSLDAYYEFEKAPGHSPKKSNYEFLKNKTLEKKILSYDDGNLQIVEFSIPSIHCSSCIWILERLHKLKKGIKLCTVDFNKKVARIQFLPSEISLQHLAELLDKIGYPPQLSLASLDNIKQAPNRGLIYKIAIAGFAFGNIMFLSFPEYFQEEGFWIDRYKILFRWLSLLFSIPVVFYAAQSYFISAFKSLRTRYLSIDIPIALGVSVLFIRSSIEVIFNQGSGFFDSLSGLVFFLLIGQFFQQKTYAFLSFERDYKSYFPLSVTVINKEGLEQPTAVNELKKGMTLLIRNNELLPVDCMLKKGVAQLDYSFVTGESNLIFQQEGDALFAGGKHLGKAILVEVSNELTQSYLTQLWSNDAFKKYAPKPLSKFTDAVSKHFTAVILAIAVITSLFWIAYDPSQVLNVFTSILIIACPCALALSAPFALGNSLRIFGQQKLYLKNANVIENMASIDTIIFDKTGTITSTSESGIFYKGDNLTALEKSILKSTLRNSNHPHSRALYKLLDEEGIESLDAFEEYSGKGLYGRYKNHDIKLGSADYLNHKLKPSTIQTSVHISTNGVYKGQFTFQNNYRKNISQLFKTLSQHYELVILTGDNDSERDNLEKLLPSKTKLLFNQKPIDKLEYVKHHQNQNSKVMMIGDGLNDAGALAQSNIGIAVTEDVNVFSPACDGIIEADKLSQLYMFIKFSKETQQIIKLSFLISFLYNIVGLYFAVTAQLTPVIAAVLMPLSSISIVVFTTLTTNYLGKKLNKLKT